MEKMDQPRMHGPVTDGRIAYALDKLRHRKKGHLQEAILLLEALQYERSHTITIDTTNAQMMRMPNTAAAPAPLIPAVGRITLCREGECISNYMSPETGQQYPCRHR